RRRPGRCIRPALARAGSGDRRCAWRAASVARPRGRPPGRDRRGWPGDDYGAPEAPWKTFTTRAGGHLDRILENAPWRLVAMAECVAKNAVMSLVYRMTLRTVGYRTTGSCGKVARGES